MMQMMTNKQPEKCPNKAPKNVCLSHINMNSIRNKLDSLFESTYGLVDFLTSVRQN